MIPGYGWLVSKLVQARGSTRFLGVLVDTGPRLENICHIYNHYYIITNHLIYNNNHYVITM